MALNRTRLADIQYIAAAAAALLTNAASTKTWIRGIILHNGNSAAETVKLYNVPDSGGAVGTAGAANIFFEQSLAAQETVFLEFPGPGIVLIDTNDTIQGVTDTASKVTVQILGDNE